MRFCGTVDQLNFAARKFRGLVTIANFKYIIFCATKFRVLVSQDQFLAKPCFTKMPETRDQGPQ